MEMLVIAGIKLLSLRKHGVHLIWVTHNLMCPEDGSRRDMRTEINRYMRTVFREEPLDPTLEDFDDKQNW